MTGVAVNAVSEVLWRGPGVLTPSSRRERHEFDCSFWASGDAFATFPAFIGPNGVGGHPPVRRGAQLAEDAQGGEVLGVYATYLKDVVGTYPDALSFGLAPPVVDDRSGCHVLTLCPTSESQMPPENPW